MDPSIRLAAIATVNQMLLTSMFALGPAAVLKFHATNDDQSIGFWSGFIVAAFQASRTLAAPFWGWYSDRTSKALIIRISLLLTGTLTCAAGLSQSLEVLGILRLAVGACSCVSSTCNAMAYQVAGTKGTAYVLTGWSAAKLLGPGLGGLLLRFHSAGYDDDFPLLVPFLVLGFLQLFAILFVPSERSHKSSDLDYIQINGDTEAPSSNTSLSQHHGAVARTIVLGGCVLFIASAMEDIIVLYAMGELHVNADLIGAVYLSAGVLELVLQSTLLWVLVQQTAISRYHVLRRQALVLYSVPFALLPFCIHPGEPLQVQVCLLGIFCGLRTSIAYVFSVTNGVLMNNASQGALGTVAGLSSAMNSVMQVFGPIVGSSTYAWSATYGGSFPADQHLTFVCAAVGVLLLALIA